MKATVIKWFKCKLTKKRYAPGMSYEGTPERIAFLQDAGYLENTPRPAPVEGEQLSAAAEEAAHEEKEPEEVVITDPDPVTVADSNAYQLMTKKELFRELSKRGIGFTQRQAKEELIGLLTK